MVKDDMESGSKAIMQTSIRVLPANEWRRVPYLGGSSLSLVPKVLPEEASVLRFRVERGDVPSCFINYDLLLRRRSNGVTGSRRFWHTLTRSIFLELLSKDTHTFVFLWGDGGPTLQDSAVLMRLSTRAEGGGSFRPIKPFFGGYKTGGPTEGSLQGGRTCLLRELCLRRASNRVQREDVRFRSPPCRTEGTVVPASALFAFVAACPCSLPALCAEGTRSVLYRPDRVSRQFGYDQGAPGPAPPLKGYNESIRRFTRAFVEELSAGYEIVVLPENSRETFFKANNCLAWRRNMDSFVNYVRGNLVVPVVSDVYHRDISLRSPKARQPGGAVRAATGLHQALPRRPAGVSPLQSQSQPYFRQG
ncbi:hypothetical protein RHGRI_029067 [Rhododendron griersonianum]|uniref:O-fucosyltransferase family protein n=1 Tax=Rhododendron griersonianum TaxID=479676 RepID=A0AAV6IHW0_9ERIC|nr:hypothetical protein RHGRI_029067 [Rhododendron griersonianum]